MKESMKVSKTVAWNLIPKEIKNIYKEMKESGNFGIHLHCPKEQHPKVGPSKWRCDNIMYYIITY